MVHHITRIPPHHLITALLLWCCCQPARALAGGTSVLSQYKDFLAMGDEELYDTAQAAEVMMYDITGRRVRTDDLRSLASQMFIVRTKQANGEVTSRTILQQ